MAIRPMIRIHNIETDEIIDREMNDEEFSIFEKEQNDLIKINKDLAEKETAKLALLERLGITEEEAKLLLS